MPQQMASRNHRLSVVDVYDIAASIGKEFEKIIDSYGPDAVTELMPKVISVLEHLEELTSKEQDETGEVEELRYTIERLEAEKAAKAEEREKYEQELEQIEDSWRLETQDLMNSVSHLQEENKRLRSAIRDKDGQESELLKAAEDVSIITQLQDTIQKQRARVRLLEQEFKQKCLDAEAMQGQIERFARLNATMRSQTAISQQRAQALIQEQVDLQVQLHDKEQEVKKIRDRLREQDNTPPLSPSDLVSLQDKLEKQGKVVYDSSDPNRPRFTMNQLRDVLQEKNELKTKLIQIEEQLQQYKPKEKEEPPPIDFDAPVYGPINKEPDEKLYPDRHASSGIRKLFQRFFEKLNFDKDSDEDEANTSEAAAHFKFLMSPGGGKKKTSRSSSQPQLSTLLNHRKR
ncbi:hypothetical protein LSH36_12g16103 [Paralvinella palmiformis]|uniref:RILP-like protein homolog n=1 Tax=Paralvinella palmiformis TaxID=53620 RepID=A0AAD9KD58_9ANNE|nr:hypothetical protein LSH36_12g16103 [Paralvinella palmiformis]